MRELSGITSGPEIERILAGHSAQLAPSSNAHPWVIMVVGVNGVGKTTTIAKIARRFKEDGRSVLMAAGDTFRAGAIEQLREWGQTSGSRGHSA